MEYDSETIPDSHELEEKVVKTPKEIKSDLDKYVIKQELAKKVLSTEIASHYMALESGYEDISFDKRNILLVGPTGVGKTYLINRIAEDLNVPFISVNAPDFTAAGYVGDNVDNIARKLLDAAGGDVKKAEKGIVCIDEIDKIASNNGAGADIGGDKVQSALLTLIEGKKVDKIDPNDALAKSELSQDKKYKIEELLGKGIPYQRAVERVEAKEQNCIDTTKILFITGGSFAGDENRQSLAEIIMKRRSKSSEKKIGFTNNGEKDEEIDMSQALKYVEPEDIVKFGMRPEFVGRVTGIVPLETLGRDDLVKILKKETDDSLVRQYKAKFKQFNIILDFEEEAYLAIADKAIKLNTGARSLNKIMFDTLIDYEFELLGSHKGKLLITKEMIENPEIDLSAIKKGIVENPKIDFQDLLKSLESQKAVTL